VPLERPDGLLIERLLDAGLTVIAVHPNQVKAMRPRLRLAGGKSDSFDSFVLAELARTDSHRFPVLVPDGDRTKALRAMTRARDGLVRTRGGVGQSAARSARVLFARREPGVLVGRLADRAGVPASLCHPGRRPRARRATPGGASQAPRLCGRKPAGELLGRLRGGAEGRAGELEMQARREVVLALVSALKPVVGRISELTVQIRHALHEHPDGQIFRSLFIASDSWLCAATMIAEIGDCRERYPTSRALAADAGQAPVAVESGKAKHAQLR
jgi:transposase